MSAARKTPSGARPNRRRDAARVVGAAGTGRIDKWLSKQNLAYSPSNERTAGVTRRLPPPPFSRDALSTFSRSCGPAGGGHRRRQCRHAQNSNTSSGGSPCHGHQPQDANAVQIRQLASRGSKRVRWIRRNYRRGDLRGARLVIAATDDPAVNELVCAEAKRRRLLVNCIAPPAAGNFIVPSQVRRGGITLAISTGGASPAFAKRLRRDLERFLSDGYPALLKKMVAERHGRRAGRTR